MKIDAIEEMKTQDAREIIKQVRSDLLSDFNDLDGKYLRNTMLILFDIIDDYEGGFVDNARTKMEELWNEWDND